MHVDNTATMNTEDSRVKFDQVLIHACAVWGAVDLSVRAASLGFRVVKAIGIGNIAGNIASAIALHKINEYVIPFVKNHDLMLPLNISEKHWEVLDPILNVTLGTLAVKAIFLILGGVTWKYALIMTIVSVATKHFSEKYTNKIDINTDTETDHEMDTDTDGEEEVTGTDDVEDFQTYKSADEVAFSSDPRVVELDDSNNEIK